MRREGIRGGSRCAEKGKGKGKGGQHGFMKGRREEGCWLVWGGKSARHAGNGWCRKKGVLADVRLEIPTSEGLLKLPASCHGLYHDCEEPREAFKCLLYVALQVILI
jgi:hypothetical protein